LDKIRGLISAEIEVAMQRELPNARAFLEVDPLQVDPDNGRAQ
jgi:hypothetical protein